MGWNTAVVLFNDMSSEWPKEIREAMTMLGSNYKMSTHFGYGKVISADHADGDQVVVVGGNTGEYASMYKPVSENSLEAMARVLQAHGYGVRGPNEKRVRNPLRYGYAAEQNDKE